MEFSEKVVILRVGTFRENDCWVRFLSPSRGIITGFAFGGRRSRRRFCGCLDHLSQVFFRVSSAKRNKYLNLEEGTLIQGFTALKQDPYKMGMVGNCLGFFEAVHRGEARSAEVCDLILSMLGGFNEYLGSPSCFFPILFRLALVFEQGYDLDVVHCASCGSVLQEHAWAGCSVEEGQVVCPQCARASMLRLSWQGLSLLHHLKAIEVGKWVGWTPGQAVQREICTFADRFIRYHVGVAETGHGRFTSC